MHSFEDPEVGFVEVVSALEQTKEDKAFVAQHFPDNNPDNVSFICHVAAADASHSTLFCAVCSGCPSGSEVAHHWQQLWTSPVSEQ